MSFSQISDLGEFKLISKLTENFITKQPTTLKGIGDDAAVIKSSDGEVILLSTDSMVEGVHFSLYSPLQHIGYKAISTAISDIYAMNGIATKVLVSLSLSNRYSVEMLETLYSGIHEACTQFNLDLIGGDTTSGKLGLSIGVTAYGHAKENKLCYRSGSKSNDILFVSGDLGAAYMGWKVLEREHHIAKGNPSHEPELESYHYILQKQLRPEARKDVIEVLENLEITPTSMIDISDGLSSEIMHLCHNADLGCKIFEDKIPVDPSVIMSVEEFGIPLSLPMLNGGEDYELLFTLHPKDYDKIKGNRLFTPIGHMTSDRGVGKIILSSGMESVLRAQGWDHLK